MAGRWSACSRWPRCVRCVWQQRLDDRLQRVVRLMPGEQFHYDPSKPIEPQIRAFLAGRNPYGSVGNENVFNDPNLYERYSTTDESGTVNYGYRAKDPRLSDVSASGVGPGLENRVIDGQCTPINWANSDSPDAL